MGEKGYQIKDHGLYILTFGTIQWVDVFTKKRIFRYYCRKLNLM